ncbi:MAG TPA: amino acid adenylation domain-containing protein [Thermoanaerobaculia bacterium]|jgi:amino acid adenylation domain-containing protein|nr:amino acid adenylation domain-containing protein [Thermoanaerobaculia bacterium]
MQRARNNCLHNVFDRQVVRSPTAVAVIDEAREMAYGELSRRANRLARHLQALGIRPETRVGLCLDRSADAVVGMLGILKAGGAYVPLDPAYPRARLAYVLADSGARLVVTHGDVWAGLGLEAAEPVLLDAHGEDIASRSDAIPISPVTAGNLAYLIYTSGSTGRAKGVAIEHRSAVAFLDWALGWYAPEDLSGVLAATSFCFDLSVFEIFAPLSMGGRVILAHDVLHLADLPAAREATLINTVPSAMTELLRAGALPASVRTVNLAGEPLRSRLAREVYATGTVQRLYNLYGPSEDTTYSTAVLVPRECEGPPTIGLPIEGTQAHVLATSLEAVADGEIGELYLGGEGLARGYLDRPQLTADRFIPDPFAGEPGARLYRTGDLVRRLPNGELAFLGRSDHQVKIRGFRIELGEIEAVLTAHPDIAEAVVQVRQAEVGEQRLVAFAELVPGWPVAISDLRAWLMERLPAYMVPSAFVLLPTLPRLPNGKIDRGALPEPGGSRDGMSTPFAAPRTAVEEGIAALWADLTGVSPVGINDLFLELGGHSLLAAQAAARLSDVFDIEVPAHACLRAGTVAGLAAEVERRRSTGASPAAIARVSREGDLPLSYAQQRLWLFDRLEPGSPVYNVAEAVRLRGALDIRALARALDWIVARHESLRTTFAVRGDAPVQVIARPETVPLAMTDLRGVPLAARERAAVAAAEAAARRPFDLEAGPLLRAALFRLAAGDHLLLVMVHHVAADGWSLDVLFRELGAGYEAYARGAEPRAPELAVQYADFAVWQRQRLQGSELETAAGRWRERLAGGPPALELPTDRPRPAVPGRRGATHRFAVTAETVAAVRRFGRGSEATLFMVLLAGWQALLSRHSGQADFAVGSPVAGRTHRALEDLIGFFVNLLPLRADLSREPSGRELVRRVRAAALDAYADQEVPFDRLVEELREDRDPSRSPVFQTVLALEETAVERRGLPGLEAARIDLDSGTAKFDLTLFVEPADGGLRCALEYRTDLFERATMARLAERFPRLLAALAASPERSVADLPLLTEEELRHLLTDHNRTRFDGGDRRPVHVQVREVAAAAPARLAIDSGRERVTYGELERRANRLAHRLQRMGVGPEAVVGVLAERSPALVEACLAVLKAGAAYLPLDPELPGERLCAMLADSRARVLLAQDRLLGKVSTPGMTVVSLDEQALRADGREDDPAVAVDPEALAYVIYTSGSTGEPKGIGVPHRGLANLAAWHRRVYALSPADRASWVAGLSFDAAVWEMWPCLAAGASLHPAPEEVRLAPAPLLDWLAAQRITVAFLPTPVAEMVLAETPPPGLALRALLTGGDKLRRRGSADLSCELVNHYGPSENSVVATCAPVAPIDATGLPPSIGRPIDNVRVYLLDTALRPVPFGAVGEMFLAGDGLARGYLGRPHLTAERFVPDPFGGAGERLYRTGDLARYREDGEFQFLGRADRQVKVRGLRIEPAEVEVCLARLAGVRQAVVSTVADAAGRPRLVAWLAGGETPSDEELRAALRRWLPAPMIPSAFVRLAAMPLTPNGKIDRRALPAPEPGEDDGAAAVARNETEELLFGIWRHVLERRSIGLHDDFFLLGGHSLLATRVISRVGAAFGIDLPLRSLFESPTVAGMAVRVEMARTAAAAAPPPPLERAGCGDRAPLSPAQQGLWFLSQLAPESSFYNIPAVLRLRGDLDAAALARALDNVVRRHEALRTILPPAADGRPEQVIAPVMPLPLPIADLRGVSAEERGRQCAERVAAEVTRPFDLVCGPLLRALLLRTGESEHVFVLTVHHAVADGWSMGVLHRELGACYAARRRGEAPVLPEPPLQYADYAVWQWRCLQEGWTERQVAFWKERLAEDQGLLEVAGDRPRAAVRSLRGATLRRAVPAPLVDALRELGGRETATPLMVLRAAFETLLYRYTGRDRFVVGTPVAGRRLPELEELIGFFVQMLPIPADLSGRPDFRDLLARVRRMALAAYDHQDVPFERLVEELRPARQEGRNPFFEILLAANPSVPPPVLPGLEVCPEEVDTGTAKFDLTLFIEEQERGIGLALEHDTDRFDLATAARLMDHLLELLAGALANPGRAVAELPMLSPSERRQLLEDWGAVASGAPLERTIPELFEERCAADPEALAVIAGEESLTYGELNRRANRLAHRLRRLGVGTDLPVGLCVERSCDLIVGLLGILKAGGAYVPLDPSYPAERLLLMMEDARLSVLVGSGSLLARLPIEGARTVLLEDAAALAGESEENPACASLPDSLAYLLFTSGSTGRPKGVAIAHRGVVRLVRGTNFAELGPDEVFFQYAPMPFDLSTLEIWGPLLNGARLVLPPPGKLSLAELGGELRRHGVTFLWLTAGLFHLMVDEQLDSLRGVRQLIAGGDVLSVPHVERTLAALDGVVINGYGPTENATFTSCHSMRSGEAFAASVPIGRPVAGTRVVVVDPDLQPVPQGVPGELLTGGHGLARGYFGRPDLTAERFIPDPFSLQPGDRLYRTGDLARWLADGTLEFLGRLDQQVKIRGFRIEPGEIEAALGEHPGVRECVVVPRAVAGDKQLVAYVVPAGGPPVEPTGLRAFLRDRLPEHMIPSAFVLLPALPLTPNAKIDRAALPAPEAHYAGTSDERFAVPRTPVETVVAELWAEVLGLPAVGLHDNFFALGGHSLKATQLVSKLRQVFRVELPLRALLRQPTVAGLGEALLEDPARRAQVERIAELLAGLDDEDEEEMDEAVAEVRLAP